MITFSRWRAFALIALSGSLLAQDPAQTDARAALARALEHLQAHAADGCYRVQWQRVHLRNVYPEATAALAILETALEGTPDLASAQRAVEAYADAVAAVATTGKPAERGQLPDTLERGMTEVARAGALIVAIDRAEDGSIPRAIAQDGTNSVTWDAQGNQLSLLPDRLFAIHTDLERLVAPLSVEESRQQAMAHMPWVTRPLGDDGSQVLRSSHPKRRTEIVLDARGLPLAAARFVGDDPNAAPAQRTLYFYAPATDATGFRALCGTLSVARRSRGRVSVDLAMIDERSTEPPAQERLVVTVPATAKMFVFGPDRRTQQLRANKPEAWPAFARERVRVAQ